MPGGTAVGFFTVKLYYPGSTTAFQETQALPLTIDRGGLEAAMRKSFTLVGDPLNLTVSGADGSGSYNVTFDYHLGNVELMRAEIVPLTVLGGSGTDRLRVQSLDEDAYWLGGADNDAVSLNLNAKTLAAFTPTEVVGGIEIQRIQPGTGTQDEMQKITVVNATGGTFQLTFMGQTTDAIAFDAPAKAVQDALVKLSTIGKDSTDAPNVGVAQAGNTYTIEFINNLKKAPQQLLTSNVVITTTTAGNAGTDAVQQIVLDHVPGGSFSLNFTYELKPLGLATDPNAVGSLAAGTYYYRVTALTADGETLPSAEASATIGTGGAIRLNWGDIPNALSYRVYRRTVSATPDRYFTTTGRAPGRASPAACRRRAARTACRRRCRSRGTRRRARCGRRSRRSPRSARTTWWSR